MSFQQNIVFGVAAASLTAASLTFGAMQFAFGHDLTSTILSVSATAAATTAEINRSGKGDRAMMIAPPKTAAMQTISVRLSEFADTSFLLRIPAVAAETAKVPAHDPDIKSAPAGQLLIKTERDEIKRPVACEPMVSVLTEVAKRLQPGRCVT